MEGKTGGGQTEKKPARLLPVFSPIGEMIRENNITNDQYSIEENLSGYPKGIYLIDIFDQEKSISRKVIIE